MSAHISTALEILECLVAFDTTSRNSNLDLICWVENYLRDYGVSSQRVYDETGTKANLWASIGPQDRAGYILSGHTDVVPVDGQAWTVPPFALTRQGERLLGRGVADMKGFVALVLALVPVMTRTPLSRPLHLAFSYDEEVGCLGARRLVSWLKEQALTFSGCVVGEPTGMQVVTAHKGKLSQIVTVKGHACHSSLAPHGVNAVSYAARLMGQIDEISQRLEQHGPRDDMYDVPFSTGHIGPVRGGTVLNIVPEECRFEYEFRCIAGDDPQALVREVEAYARDVLEPQMQRKCPETGIEFRLRSDIPALDTPPDVDIVTLGRRLGGRNDHAKVSYGTEAGLFARLGIPTIVIGPGHIAQAHTPDEYLDMAQLAQGLGFVERLIGDCA